METFVFVLNSLSSKSFHQEITCMLSVVYNLNSPWEQIWFQPSSSSHLQSNSSVFPLCWKISRITPVYKSGEKYKVANYRGISIISNVSKIFEHILYRIIYNHVVNYLAFEQHRFRKGTSTTTNLCTFVKYIHFRMC